MALTLFAAVAPSAAMAARPDDRVPGRYIVVYDSSVSSPDSATDAREQRDGFRAALRYGRAVKGFAARLSQAQVDRLQADGAVASITPDRRVRALGALAVGEAAPTGVRRLQAVSGTTAREASSVNVAVIDTGIDLDHPDLNVAAGRNCVNPAAAPDDDNGHGTHVAGTIGARNDGAGVVGVAPGTRLFAAKVLDAQGAGTASQVICGIDWVTSTRTDADPTNDIAVANMSLGGAGSPVGSCATTSDPEHKAICNSVAAGVTYVVAAGNSGWDFDFAFQPDLPAAYPQVLTVTALTDSDGQPGGTGGAPACRTSERDDRYASFSNYAATSAGQAHTIAAPGTCIRSTWLNGGYSTISGTSMATPHMTAAVALCLAENGVAGPCAGLTPAQIVAKMRADAQQINSLNTWYGFTGDPLHSPVAGRYYGFSPFAGAGAPVAPPPPPPPPAPTTVTATPSSATIVTGTLRSGSVTSLTADDTTYLQVNSTTTSTRTSAWYGTFTGVPTALSALKATYKGKASATCSQTLAFYRWTDGQWVTVDSRSIGTTDTLIADRSPTGTLSSYVSSTGQVRVRVRCTRTTSSFFASGNLLKLTYAG
ncbi:MAG TPA: S8 family serine peptidase [Solirubrobacteraceae bacterium]